MSSLAPAPEGAAPGAASPPASCLPRRRLGRDGAFALVLAAALAALAFTTSGGFAQSAPAGETWTDIVITLLGAGACGAAVLFAPAGRAWGSVTVGLFAGLTALTAVSIAWSVAPDYSWQDSSQTLAYLAAFAGAAALARLAPQRWPALVGALAAASTALAAYALLAKVFPAALDADDTLGRLQAPFGYWNAVGVSAAIGLVPCLWVAARRTGGRVLRAVSVPALALQISVVVLSYSRSAALVAVLGVAAWLAVVPLRLRAILIFVAGTLGAAVITGWALATHSLTSDKVPLAARSSAGHTFGVVLLLTLTAMTLAGATAAIAMDRVALPAPIRRRIGTALVILVGLVPVAGVVAVAGSSRGLSGEVSHVWDTLTSTRFAVGDNPGRLLQLGNSRPVYWSEGIAVGRHALLNGVGAAGYAIARERYATNPLPSRHAHSYVIQTFADLGLIGLALNLALLVAWGIAAGRPLAIRTSWRRLTPEQAVERQGLMTLAVVVLAFGVQSAIDWTWFFAGVALPALVCAGWLAGRGPLAAQSPSIDPVRPVPPVGPVATVGAVGAVAAVGAVGPLPAVGAVGPLPAAGAVGPVGQVAVGPLTQRRSILQYPGRAAIVIGLITIALLGGWMIWQPLRSVDAVSASLTAAAHGQTATAFNDARDAAQIDPLAIEPLQILSSLYAAVGQPTAARAELLAAVRRQPENGATWQWLGASDLSRHQPRSALRALTRARALDQTNATTIALFNQAWSQQKTAQPRQ